MIDQELLYKVAQVWRKYFTHIPPSSFLITWSKYDLSDVDAALCISRKWLDKGTEGKPGIQLAAYTTGVLRNIAIEKETMMAIEDRLNQE